MSSKRVCVVVDEVAGSISPKGSSLVAGYEVGQLSVLVAREGMPMRTTNQQAPSSESSCVAPSPLNSLYPVACCPSMQVGANAVSGTRGGSSICVSGSRKENHVRKTCDVM